MHVIAIARHVDDKALSFRSQWLLRNTTGSRRRHTVSHNRDVVANNKPEVMFQERRMKKTTSVLEPEVVAS